MKKGGARAPSQRQLRVMEEVEHVLAYVIERDELHDPGIGRRADHGFGGADKPGS